MVIDDNLYQQKSASRLELDLDDGVKVNYAKFQKIEVGGEGKKKLKINLLAKI